MQKVIIQPLLEMFGVILLKYATFVVSIFNPTGFDEKKRFDLTGAKYFNKVLDEFILTPHVHEKDTAGGIREAEEDEIPKQKDHE